MSVWGNARRAIDVRDLRIWERKFDMSVGRTLEKQEMYWDASSKAGKTSAINKVSVSRRAMETNWTSLFLRGYFLRVSCITIYTWILAPIDEIEQGICSHRLVSCVFSNTSVAILKAARQAAASPLFSRDREKPRD